MKFQKPYIRKLKTVSKFTVWIVDGAYIRCNIDEEFTNCGQHHKYKFIPEKELWIDRARTVGEDKYYIASMLIMDKLRKKGMSRKKLIKIANAVERFERHKSKLLKQIMRKKLDKKKILDTIRVKLLRKYSNGVKVWIVNGELVRGLFWLDFTEGGHDYIYSFIPDNEVWLDDDLFESEIRYVLLHELHERNLMIKGMSYAKAHKHSSELEKYCRNHPAILETKLKEELEETE
jgi:hypothetical protein